MASRGSLPSFHHDGVFLDDSDEQNDADQSDDAEFRAAEEQRENRAHASRGKRGENRDGMNVAFVQNAKHDVHCDHRGQDQDGLIRKGSEEGRRCPLKRSLDAGRHIQFPLPTVDGVDGIAQGGTRRQVERKSDHGKLALMVQSERCFTGIEVREGAERHLRAIRGFDVNILQRFGILLKLRIDFHDDVILVQLREDGGDLALAESVVKRVVNVRRKNAESRCGVPVDGE